MNYSLMNLVLDWGNTRIKGGVYEGLVLKERLFFATAEELHSFLKKKTFAHTLVSSVSHPAEEVLASIHASGKKIKLEASLPLPIVNKYATPHTLGVDRLAAACGAYSIFPKQNCLVIDAGTCINYEFINDEGEYLGGAISPGVHMRLEAMHKFTARLPLVELNKEAPLIGNSTESCMQSGVMNGVVSEIKGTIERYSLLYPGLGVVLCGGDAILFENNLKPAIFVAPDLVLNGLNSILLYNVSI